MGSNGLGGAIFNGTSGILTIAPRLGARRSSQQSKATNTITASQAVRGQGGPGGAGGAAFGGVGGAPGGMNGQAHPGASGTSAVSGVGVGGGLDLFPAGTVTIDNTNITGNTASTADNDVSGTFSA